MKQPAILSAVAVSILAFAVSSAFAAEPSKFDPKKPLQPTVTSKAEKGKAADVKIVSDDSKNSTTPAPATRASDTTCDIHVDNRTNLIIHRVYVDGRNWGGVGRYGDAMARDVGIGGTTLYAEADWSDGTTSRWGPHVFNCRSWATYRWSLTR